MNETNIVPSTTNATAWSPALIELYVSRREALVRCAQQVLCDRSLAEECVQEVFMKYHLKDVSPQSGAEAAYLRAMARNQAVSMVRSEQRGREITACLPEPSPVPSPETVVLAHLAAQDLAARVQQLAPRQAEVIELRLAGMSVAQTARHLAIADGTVKTHRHRAAEALSLSLDAANAA